MVGEAKKLIDSIIAEACVGAYIIKGTASQK